MKNTNHALTAEQASQLKITEVLELFFEHELASMPRIKNDKNSYHPIESKEAWDVIRTRAAEHVHPEAGGLKWESYRLFGAEGVQVRLAGHHRKASWEKRVSEGTAVKLTIHEIPSTASVQDCVRGLGLQHPYDFYPVYDRADKNRCLGYAFLTLPTDAANQLMDPAKPKSKICEVEVTIKKARPN